MYFAKAFITSREEAVLVNRTPITFLIFALFLPVAAQGAPPVVVRRPSLTCPQTDLGSPDLQAHYTTMWEKYSADAEKASTELQEEINRQTKAAIDSGNLDLSLFWKGVEKGYKENGEIKWDEASLSKSWKDRFGDTPFPTDFVEVIKNSIQRYMSITTELQKSYGQLVVELTKADKLERAVKIRDEIRNLLADTAATNPRPKPVLKPAPKPVPKPVLTYLAALPAFEKRLQNNWFETGSVWGKPITYKEIRGDRSIFLHAKPDGVSAVKYRITPDFDRFESGVFVPQVKAEQGNPATPLTFEVLGDGRGGPPAGSPRRPCRPWPGLRDARRALPIRSISFAAATP